MIMKLSVFHLVKQGTRRPKVAFNRLTTPETPSSQRSDNTTTPASDTPNPAVDSAMPSAMRHDSPMAGAPRGRAQRGNGPRISNPEKRTAISMNFRVDLEVDRLARQGATLHNISVSAYYRQLVRNDVVDEKGRPAWTPEPPNVTPGGSNAVFQVDAEIYRKASTAADCLGISVAEYYRQLVRRDQVTSVCCDAAA
ncbi:hypothetical protein AB0D67_30790 [Streptosporangium sp. NPDC048047]|uniref:hypothetical protein n=1 Tax=Streptosporangium sp. NPDC048047 TaxID=3155748 RepID=UPI00341A29E1